MLLPADPWQPIIYKDNFTEIDYKSIIDKIDPILDQCETSNSYLEKDGGVSSVQNSKQASQLGPIAWDEFNPFREWLTPRIKQAVNNWGLPDIHYSVDTSWINRHTTGAWTDEHVHKATAFVAVYYLKAPENCGNLLVRNPLEYHWNFYPEKDSLVEIWKPIPITTGDLILFPGWLYHKSEVNKSLDTRYVMSVNFVIAPKVR
jgi:uncharacterized protein (TIGR02466 family)